MVLMVLVLMDEKCCLIYDNNDIIKGLNVGLAGVTLL